MVKKVESNIFYITATIFHPLSGLLISNFSVTITLITHFKPGRPTVKVNTDLSWNLCNIYKCAHKKIYFNKFLNTLL